VWVHLAIFALSSADLGRPPAVDFNTALLLEQSLSVANLFVFGVDLGVVLLQVPLEKKKNKKKPKQT